MGSRSAIEIGVRGAAVGALVAAAWACSAAAPEQVIPDPGGGGSFVGDPNGSGGGPGLSDGNEADGFDGTDACAGEKASAQVSAAVLQLIVDTSGSMDQNAPGATTGSKWQATRRALLDAVSEMPAQTAVGVIFYPDVANGNDSSPSACFDREADVTIGALDALGSAQRREIQTAFQAQVPNGGTPTHDAYDFGVRALESATAPGARFAVVITDGTPTYSLGCAGTGLISDPVDPTPLVGAARGFAADGIKTFVIGSPGSEGARESLSRMAEAGGTASPGCSHTGPNYCHFDMTRAPDFAVALSGALGQIAGLALSCSYDIPTPPNGAQLVPNKVNVLFRPLGSEQELIAQSSAARCTEGWQYSSDQKQVLLCGTTCDRVRNANGTVTLEFGCATQIR